MDKPNAGALIESVPVGVVVAVNGPTMQDWRSPLRSRRRCSHKASHPARERSAGGHAATLPPWVNCKGLRPVWQA
ncbi:hypothetical protein LJR290_003448 [Variovorax sp. LjRoot290]|uniref:hypothetical protein n=1 Tax=Variovorax sp. LjRoot290 TaxID=3342316 RepID=UPI003ECF7B9B